MGFLARYSMFKSEPISKEEECLVQEDLMSRNIFIEQRQKERRHGVICMLIIQLFLILIYTAMSAWIVRMAASPRDLIYSPAREAVSYQQTLLSNPIDEMNPFKGQPRPELDEAWRKLIQYQSVRVQEDDLVKINRTSLPLSDGGGGYLAVVDVFHELHCLNYVREYLHRDVYHIKETPETQILHVDHCIDTLRQTLMCHGDIALHTFDWIPDYRRPWPNFNVVHECRNFEAIYDWAEKHSVPTLAGNVLIHPELGECAPEPKSAPLPLAKERAPANSASSSGPSFPV